MYNGVFDPNDRRIRYFDLPRPLSFEFQAGDKVFYTGSRFASDLTTKEGKLLVGWIHAPVVNQPGVFVVEFPDAKEGDFIISAKLLSKAKPAKEKDAGPEIQPRRKRKAEEEAQK